MSVCLIPMRSQSKRLPNKNVIDFFGSPIFTYPLSTARRSGLFSKIIIACDKEYEELVKRSVPLNTSFSTETIIYVRDPENSKDESGLIDLVREVVEHFKITDETMCILYSTSVLTTISQLTRGLKELDKRCKCVFPVVNKIAELDIWPKRVYESDITHDFSGYNADAWFWFSIYSVLGKNKIIQEENGYVELKDYEAQPIHTQEDVEDLKKKYRLMQIEQIERQNEYIKRFK